MSSAPEAAPTPANSRTARRRAGANASAKPSSGPDKVRMLANALKLGIYSRGAVLFHENTSEYHAHVDAFLAKFQPIDTVERRLVLRIADADWRLQRQRALEAATLDLQMDETEPLVNERFESIDEASRLAFACQLLDTHQLAVYLANQRAETGFSLQYQRDYQLLVDMQNARRCLNNAQAIQNIE